jgi:hypothetical protein
VPDLERELRGLAPAIAWPETPDLAPAVLRRIEAAPERRARPRHGRRALVVAFAVLAVAVGAVMAVPSARTAVLEWLGLRGVTVEVVETVPSVPEKPPDFGVGDPVTAAEAESRIGFPLPDPSSTSLGPPDEIRYTGLVADGQVAWVWRDEDGSPETLLTVFRAGIDEGFIEKMVGADVAVSRETVSGRRALWLAGAHSFIYTLPNGEGRDETARLAGPTLLWEDGDRLYRLEGDFTLPEALAIAEDVTP